MEKLIRQMLVTHSYHAPLALRLALTPDKRVQSTATDGRQLFYNPEWVMENTADKILGNIGHAVTACGLKHHTRRQDRDPQKWQWASYQVRLPFVRDAGLTNEPGGLDDVSVERAYEMAPDGDEDDQPQQSGSVSLEFAEGDGPPEQSDQGDPQDGQGGSQQSGGDQQAGEGDQQQTGQGDSQQDMGAPSPNETGIVMDLPREDGQGEAEYQQACQQEEQDWDVAAQTAEQMAKSAGSSGGRLSETLKASHTSDVDYNELIRRFMYEFFRSDYSWLRPNRRHVHMGLFTPALHHENVGRVGVLIDSSISMHTPTLRQIYGDVKDAARELMPHEIVLIWGDTEVKGKETYHPDELPDELEIQGRGGTKYQPLFDALEDMPPVACILFYTDLQPNHGYFGEAPEAPLLWLVRDRDMRSVAVEPDFGEIVEVPTLYNF